MEPTRVHIAVLAIADDPARMEVATARIVTDRAILAGHRIYARATVIDVEAQIREQLKKWIADPEVDVVIVTGGVESDHASPALRPLITQPVPGFTDLFRYLAFQEIGASAMLSNAEAAQCESTFVFVLPASEGAVRAAMDKLIVPQLDRKTTPKNLVSQMPRLKAAEIDAVPQVIVAEKTATGAGLKPKLPAMPAPRERPRTGANVIARKPDDPATKPIDLAGLEKQIALSAQGSPNDAPTKRIDLGGLPRLPPGADADLLDADELADDTATTTQPAPAPKPLPSIIKPAAAAPVARIELKRATPVPKLAPTVEPTVAPTVAPTVEPTVAPTVTPAVEPEPIETLDAEPVVDDEPAVEAPAPRVRPPTAPPPIPAARARTLTPPPPLRADDGPEGVFVYPVQRRGGNRALRLLLLAAVPVIGFAIVVFVLSRDSKPAAPRDPVASVEPAAPAPVAAEPSAPIIDPAPVDASAPVDPPAPAVEDPPAPATTRPSTKPTTTKSSTTKSSTTTTKPATRPATTPAETSPAETPEEPPAPPAVAADPGCDEVSCVLEKYDRPCCERFRPAGGTTRTKGGIPEELDRTTVRAAIGKIKPTVIKCGEKSGVKGTVKLSVSVAPEGTVREVSVQEAPDQGLGQCVATAMRRAVFGKSVAGGSFVYPFVF